MPGPLKATKMQLHTWLPLPTRLASFLKGPKCQTRGCLSHSVPPKKWVPYYTHKRDPSWLFSEEKSVAFRRVSSTQILGGGSCEDGPLTTVNGSLKRCLSFSLCLESCWPQRKRAPSWALAPPCSPNHYLLHTLNPLTSQEHAHMV